MPKVGAFGITTSIKQSLGDCFMTIATIQKILSERYDFLLTPIFFSSDQRKALYQFFKHANFLASQAEALTLINNDGSEFQSKVITTYHEFLDLYAFLEDAVNINNDRVDINEK